MFFNFDTIYFPHVALLISLAERVLRLYFLWMMNRLAYLTLSCRRGKHLEMMLRINHTGSLFTLFFWFSSYITSRNTWLWTVNNFFPAAIIRFIYCLRSTSLSWQYMVTRGWKFYRIKDLIKCNNFQFDSVKYVPEVMYQLKKKRLMFPWPIQCDYSNKCYYREMLKLLGENQFNLSQN